MTIRLAGDVLAIHGLPALLRTLGETVEWVAARADPAAGEHLHVEYYEGHAYLSPDSLAMVVALRASGGS